MFAIIIIVFAISFGPNSTTCSPPVSNTVAEVDGTKISREQLLMGMMMLPAPPSPPRKVKRDERFSKYLSWQRASTGYNNCTFIPQYWSSQSVLRRYWTYMPKILTYQNSTVCIPNPYQDHGLSMIKAFYSHPLIHLVPEAKAMNDLLELFIVSNAARRAGLRIEQAELREAMYASRFFRKGKFDDARFNSFVRRQLRTTVPTYTDFVRRSLLRLKMMAYIRDSVLVSPAELQYRFTEEQRKVGLEFVKFEPKAVGRFVTVSDKDANAALKTDEKKIKAFMNAVQTARVRLIKITATSLRTADLKARQNRILQNRLKKEQDAAKKVDLIKMIAKNTQYIATIKRARIIYRKKAEKILAHLKDPKKLIEPPKQSTDRTKKEKFVSTDKKKDAKTPPAPKKVEPLHARFAEVAKTYSSDKTGQKTGGLVAAFKHSKLQPTLSKAIFSAPLNGLTSVIEEKDGYYIAFVEKRKFASFEKDKLAIAKEYVKQKRLPDAAKTQADAFLALAKKNGTKSLKEVAALFNAQLAKDLGLITNGAKTKVPPFFVALTVKPFARSRVGKRFGREYPVPWAEIDQIGTSKPLARRVFSLTTAAPLLDTPFKIKKAFVVVRLDKLLDADPTAKQSRLVMDKLRLRLESEQASATYREYVTQLFSKLKAENEITIEKDRLGSYAASVGALEKSLALSFKEFMPKLRTKKKTIR